MKKILFVFLGLIACFFIFSGCNMIYFMFGGNLSGSTKMILYPISLVIGIWAAIDLYLYLKNKY